MKRSIIVLTGVCMAMLLLLLCAACGTGAAKSAQGTTDTPKNKINTADSKSGKPKASSTSKKDFDRVKLIKMAIKNQKNSYAPYSKYNVSAAVLMDSGKIYLGANIENASYPAGVCAEHNAIDYAVQSGERKIKAIAIVGGADYKVHDYCAPCGICRQVMREFSDPKQMKVIIAVSSTKYKEMTLEELLPESFGPSNLD